MSENIEYFYRTNDINFNPTLKIISTQDIKNDIKNDDGVCRYLIAYKLYNIPLYSIIRYNGGLEKLENYFNNNKFNMHNAFKPTDHEIQPNQPLLNLFRNSHF